MNSENPTGNVLVAHATAELDRIGETSSMRECVLDVVRTVSEQEHSGSSARRLIVVLEKLLRFQRLTPITDSPDEWHEVLPPMHDPELHPSGLWQSKHDSECFSEDGGRTYRRNSERQVLHGSVVARPYPANATTLPSAPFTDCDV